MLVLRNNYARVFLTGAGGLVGPENTELLTVAARLVMIALARFFYWRDALVIVRPDTFIRWHRTVFKMFWRWKSRKRGRPALPKNLRELIRQMARETQPGARNRSQTNCC